MARSLFLSLAGLFFFLLSRFACFVRLLLAARLASLDSFSQNWSRPRFCLFFFAVEPTAGLGQFINTDKTDTSADAGSRTNTHTHTPQRASINSHRDSLISPLSLSLFFKKENSIPAQSLLFFFYYVSLLARFLAFIFHDPTRLVVVVDVRHL